jgi:hypothetical protein
MECQRSKTHAKKEIAMQIILAFEVCEEGSLADFKPYPTNL